MNNKTAIIIAIILIITPINIISIAYAIYYFFNVELANLPPLTFSILTVQASAITAYFVARNLKN